MYLEICNVAAAVGKNPYESKEKTLLISWARHCPVKVLNYLINNKCIVKMDQFEVSYTELEKQTVSDLLPKEYDIHDFTKIENTIINEYKKKRNNEQDNTEIEHLKEYTQDLLKKTNGNNQEHNIIQKEEYIKGNDKMYYYNIFDDACIGGKNDARINDILLEIKTRTKKQNIRKNEYDLYQLICYLLASGLTKGKIVQVYDKIKYDSDLETDKEYGIIDLNEDIWIKLSDNIVFELQNYFNMLRELIKTSNYIYLSSVIPLELRPISKYQLNSNNGKVNFFEDNIKFKNLLKNLLKFF
tara:strand:+ start:4994 stop:5890 length:897 start_codon:yes stop_codon:yes gene_type:complete